MKKIILVGFLALTGILTTKAQRVQEGQKQLNVGVGLNSGLGLPVYAGIDYGVHPDITVGGEVSYATKNYTSYGNYNIRGHWVNVSANGNYHFNRILQIPNVWDLYAGVSLAYNSFSYSFPDGYNGTGFVRNNSGLGFAGQIGGRYYFNNNFGVNLELGGGNLVSGGKLGISYKF